MLQVFSVFAISRFQTGPIVEDTKVHRWVMSSLNLCLCINWKLMSIPLFTKNYFILFEFTLLLNKVPLMDRGCRDIFWKSLWTQQQAVAWSSPAVRPCKGKASIAFAPTPTYCTCTCNPNRTGPSSDDWFSTDTAPLHPHSQGPLLLLLLNLKAPFHTTNHASLGFRP